MFRKELETVLKDCLLQRLSVFLRDNEPPFSGVLTQFDHKTYVFEQCKSLPMKDGETAVPFKGRVIVPRVAVRYLVDVDG